MAYTKQIKTADGGTVTAAYIVPGQINVGVADKGGLLYLHSFRSAAAMDAGMAPLSGETASKAYSFTPAQYEAASMLSLRELFGAGVFPLGDPRGDITMYQVNGTFAYHIALNRKDVPVLDAQGAPVLGAGGVPLMESFLDGAVKT